MPLYNYAKNSYEIIRSYSGYGLKYLHSMCVVKAPNRQVYLIERGLRLLRIINVSKGTTPYQHEFNDNVIRLFHSMPIANVFVLVIIYRGDKREIVIHVIDLMREKKYIQKYPVGKIIETMMDLLEKNAVHHNVLNSVKNLWKGKFYFEERKASVINSIDVSFDSLVFYDRCMFKFDLSFWNTKEGPLNINNALSVVATCQNNELTINLQINSKIKIETYSYTHEIDFGSNTLLMSRKYEFYGKYNILDSALYSIIVADGDYTIINEPNLCPSHNYCTRFVLYYKNEPKIVFGDTDFGVSNFSGALLIRASDKILAFANKDGLLRADKINEYYVVGDSSGIIVIDKDGYSGVNITSKNHDSDISIIKTEAVRDLLMDGIRKSNNINWVGIDITDKVQHLALGDKLKKAVRRYVGYNNRFEVPVVAYYIDYEEGELYLLVWIHLIKAEKIKVCLFRSKIDNLLNKHISFILAWEFETEVLTVLTDDTSILSKINLETKTANRSLRLLSNKLNIGHGLINLRLFIMYNAENAYYDYGYNRRSISMKPVDTSIVTTLHLVRRILVTQTV